MVMLESGQFNGERIIITEVAIVSLNEVEWSCYGGCH